MDTISKAYFYAVTSTKFYVCSSTSKPFMKCKGRFESTEWITCYTQGVSKVETIFLLCIVIIYIIISKNPNNTKLYNYFFLLQALYPILPSTGLCYGLRLCVPGNQSTDIQFCL